MVHDLLKLIGGLGSFIPPTFYRVFALARILEDQNSGLLDETTKGQWRQLCQPETVSDDRKSAEENRLTINGYTLQPRTRRIRGFEELHMVSPEDLMRYSLPELLFKAEEGELMIRDFPVTGDPDENIPKGFEEDGNHGRLNGSEQSLYILLDYSYSMREANRMVLAQTLALYYLAKKYKGKSRPRLFFRAFAIGQSPLAKADHWEEIPGVVRAILDSEPGEKGTDLQSAILTAVKDIKYHCSHTKAEILILTDCQVRIDPVIINEAKADIKIHLIKIGDDEVAPVASEVKDLMEGKYLFGGQDKEELGAKLFQELIRGQFKAICETILLIPDLDPSKVRVEMAQLEEIQTMIVSILATEPARADWEAHRLAVFCQNLISYMIPLCQGEILKKANRLAEQLDRWLTGRLTAEMIQKIISNGDINLTMEKNFLEKVRGHKNAKDLFANPQFRLAIRLWRKTGSTGLPIPYWILLRALFRALVQKFFSRGSSAPK